MLSRLLLFLLLCAAALPVFAQAPGTVERRDIDGDYRRPDLNALLFDPLMLRLTPDQVEAIVQEMRLIARNLPDSSAVNHRLRSRALAVALHLMPDDRSAIIANGQLARRARPSPLAVNITVTPEGVAQRLLAAAGSLINAQELSARQLAMLVLDIALQLDPRLRRQIFPLTYGTTPDWGGEAPETELVDAPPEFRLLEAEVQLLLPAVDKGQIKIVTVRTSARSTPGQKGLRINLPEALMQQMQKKEGAATRREVEERMAALRAALRLRHEVWPAAWTLEISVSGQDQAPLPQLFAGMALTLDALLSGEALDPECLIALHSDVKGNTRAVLPLETLLPAAALQKAGCLLVLPHDVAEELNDWIFLHPDQWTLLFRLTMHCVPALPDAMALIKSKRADRLEQSMARFGEIAARLRAAGDPLVELRRPETTAQLREVTMWHPHHLSAAALLSVAAGGPATLSAPGSLRYIDRLAQPVLSTNRAQFPLHVPHRRFVKTEFGRAGEALQAAFKKLDPAVRPYATEVITLARMLDRTAGTWKAYLKDNGPPDPPEVGAQRGRAASLRQQFETRP